MPIVNPTLPVLPRGYITGALMAFTSVTTVTLGTAAVVSAMRNSTNLFDITFTGTLTADITVAGAGGLDTGIEASNTFYAVFIIADPTGVNATSTLLSVSATAPTLPAGYTIFRRVGWVRNNSASDFIGFTQSGVGNDRQIAYAPSTSAQVVILSGGTGSFPTTISAAALMPSTSRTGIFGYAFTPAAPGRQFQVSPTGAGGAGIRTFRLGVTATSSWIQQFSCDVDSIQQIDYGTNNVDTSLTLSVDRYTDSL